MVFHTNYLVNGIFDAEKNTTIIKISFEKPDYMRNLMKKWFDRDIDFIQLGITTYNFKNKHSIYKWEYGENYKDLESINEIHFFDKTKISGYKDLLNQEGIGSVLIKLNPNLDKHINFANLYSNSDFGVQEMIGLNFTKKLIFVEYEY